MSNRARIGEPVSFEFNGSTSSTSSVAVTIYDSNRVVRPLAASERLAIDEVEIAPETGNAVFLLAAPAGSSTIPGTIIAFDPAAAGGFPITVHVDENEINVPTGITPSVLNSTGGAVACIVTGIGRILSGKSRGQYPNWQAGTTPGQTVGRAF